MIYIYPQIMHEYTKKERQRLIKKIIDQGVIGDQLHLLKELNKYSVNATQATISRDLQELGVVKVRVNAGVYKYAILDTTAEDYIWSQLETLFRNFVVEIKSTNNLIVIITAPGNAHGVARLIDALERKPILGTIAGDDTLLIIINTVKNRNFIEKEFKALLQKVT